MPAQLLYYNVWRKLQNIFNFCQRWNILCNEKLKQKRDQNKIWLDIFVLCVHEGGEGTSFQDAGIAHKYDVVQNAKR